MKPEAIIFTSKTGFTEKYARLLGEKTGLPVYSMKESGVLAKGTAVIYMGWLMASHISGYEKAAGSFLLSAVCAVGLCDTGTLLEETRRATKIPDNIPLFTLQGGLNMSKLKGINKFIIKALGKTLSAKENKTEQDERMCYLVTHEGDYVSEENLSAVLKWYEENGKA